jgi:hypothetical protein
MKPRAAERESCGSNLLTAGNSRSLLILTYISPCGYRLFLGLPEISVALFQPGHIVGLK